MRTYVTIDTEKFNDKVRLFLKNYDFILDWPLSTFTNIRLLGILLFDHFQIKNH